MKYMGSKRSMLQNGLGELICQEAKYVRRIVDLFCGAGSVAWFTAEKTPRPVLAVDLQTFSAILARAVIGRNFPLDSNQLIKKWLNKVKNIRCAAHLWREAVLLEKSAKKLVLEARALCKELSRIGPIWNAYGGHYFSPTQALTFDYMLKYLPTNEPERSVCIAATIFTASKCAAAPGHTAQPFQPTPRAEIFILEAWERDPLLICKKALHEICPRHAIVPGKAFVSDAIDFVKNLKSEDLVFIDPPYSGVQYSRFYHVFETIAQGQCNSVIGVGRYPPIEDRPQSYFSNKSQSKLALEKLISSLANIGVTVIFTFPSGECSNGLSGKIVIETAQMWFNVGKKIVKGRFSTLGGNNIRRTARKSSEELLLLMYPKKRH
ncbi:MAG: adenine methyltransferase [Planctomycetes bacterium]|nr:adenine methyltransferase [Planctomycetota bacterium]